MTYAKFSPLFTGANCAYILIKAAEKLIQNFNDVIRAYLKYFRKKLSDAKYAEFDSVLTATNCASI